MGGRFILSLDCEGKWGVSDLLNSYHQKTLSDERLHFAYSAIVDALRRAEIRATFAFTEIFIRSRDELLALPIDDLARAFPYTRNGFEDLRNGSREGWSAPWAVDMIAANHEVACHGVTHSPWTGLTAAQARCELSLFDRPKGQTFIFPRNEVAHLDVLEEHGFTGYRLAPRPASRARSLLRELNFFSGAESPAAAQPLQPIPAGCFVNWRHGPRAAIPPAVTRLRARRILEHAAETGGVAHFWTHPENIASAPATLENLTAVLEEVAKLRRRGRLEVVTQIEFVRQTRVSEHSLETR